MDLFEQEKPESSKNLPLAARMRPRDLSEFIGQQHILAEDKLLRRAISADRLSSLILYGPPGCGKTCLAHVISNVTRARFVRLNAVESNVSELRDALNQARHSLRQKQQRTILFIDELHRFNKAQQDVLMPDVEEGNIVLIGATTHNPFFYLVGPLLSRSQVFELKPLAEEDIRRILDNALNDKQRGLGNIAVKIDPAAIDFLAKICDGDARRALNALEIGVLTTLPGPDKSIHYTLEVAQDSAQKKAVGYDRDEDGHYDTISAFIKSMRGSDPDAAIYWLAKMLYSGEDPRFIARRIVICAAEDVGLADPQALVLAQAALGAAEFVGMPEARIPLAQAAVYIAAAPKSNAAYLAIEQALEDVKNDSTAQVPQHLKDASYTGAKKLGRGADYKYAHDYPQHYVKQDYLGREKKYYCPGGQGFEKTIKEWLEKLKTQK